MPASSATTPRDFPTRTATRDVPTEPDDGNETVVGLKDALSALCVTNVIAIASSWLVRNQQSTLDLLCYNRPEGSQSYPTNSDFAVYVFLTTASTLVTIGSAFFLYLSSTTNDSQDQPQESRTPANQAVPTPIGRSTDGVVVGEPVRVSGASSSLVVVGRRVEPQPTGLPKDTK